MQTTKSAFLRTPIRRLTCSAMCLASAFTTAIPGILVQLVLIPVLVSVLRKANIME